ncbi:MAG: hypothetical protein WC447_03415 [Candidatus Paceibacterota bacterium]
MKYTKIAKQLGSKGGKKSAQVRFSGLTKEQKSELMRKVRLTPRQKKEVDLMMNESIESLRKVS